MLPCLPVTPILSLLLLVSHIMPFQVFSMRILLSDGESSEIRLAIWASIFRRSPETITSSFGVRASRGVARLLQPGYQSCGDQANRKAAEEGEDVPCEEKRQEHSAKDDKDGYTGSEKVESRYYEDVLEAEPHPRKKKRREQILQHSGRDGERRQQTDDPRAFAPNGRPHRTPLPRSR